MKAAHRVTVSVATLALAAACGSGSTGASGSKSAGTTGTAGTHVTKLKIMVGGISKQIYLPNQLTKSLGYFKAEGLDVTLIDEASGQSSEEQTLTGNVDAGSGSYNHTIELQAAGKSMETVVQLQTARGRRSWSAARTSTRSRALATCAARTWASPSSAPGRRP